MLFARRILHLHFPYKLFSPKKHSNYSIYGTKCQGVERKKFVSNYKITFHIVVYKERFERYNSD